MITDVERIARDAGIACDTTRNGLHTWIGNDGDLERFAAFVRAQALEYAAKVCDEARDTWVDGSDQCGQQCQAKVRATPSTCAAAIRALKG